MSKRSVMRKQLRGDSVVWVLVVLALVFAGLLASSLGASGASSLFQSVISPAGPTATNTPVVTEEPTVPTTPTVFVVEPTPFPTADLPPTVPPPPTMQAEATFTPVPIPIAPSPTAPPAAKPSTGGPAPILWIIVGLVIVGLVVIIAISPKKPKEQ